MIINRVFVDKIDVEEIKKEDLENMGPRTDEEFPAKVDDAFYANGEGNVQNYDVAVNAMCEETDEEVDAEAEKTDEDLDAMIKQWMTRTETLLHNAAAVTAAPSSMLPSVCSSISAF